MSEFNVYWYTQNQKDVPETLDWLHEEEQKVLAGFKFEKRKKDWLLGRWTAKNAVSVYGKTHNDKKLNVPFQEIEIKAATSGAPEVFLKAQKAAINISISHSFGICLCTISNPDFEMGCDIEKVEERSPLFYQDYFTEKEKSFISSQKPSEKWLWTNLIWSAKEAALKAKRTGLRIDPLRTEVEIHQALNELVWNKVTVRLIDKNETYYGFWSLQGDMASNISSNSSKFSVRKLL